MNPRSRRGIVDPITLAIVAGLAAGYFLGGWKPLAMFKKEPPTKQLTELQAKLDATTAEAERARLAREAAVVAERAKLEAQVRAAQLDNSGTVAALRKVPASSQTPEVKLAARMATRVDIKLVAAIGRLPEAEQQAMVELIEQALSGKQAEVDEANRKLAELDAEFKTTTKERDELRIEIPKLTKQVSDAESEAKKVQADVTVVTNKVKSQAEKLFQADQESSSLGNAVKGLLGLLALLATGWVILAFVVPAILQYLPSNHFKTALRDISGVASGGLHYLDARRKLTKFNTPPTP